MFFSTGHRVRLTNVAPTSDQMQGRHRSWPNALNSRLGQVGTVINYGNHSDVRVRFDTSDVEYWIHEDFVSFESSGPQQVRFYKNEAVRLRTDCGLPDNVAGLTGVIQTAAPGTYHVVVNDIIVTVDETQFYPVIPPSQQYRPGDYIVLSDCPLLLSTMWGRRVGIISNDHGVLSVLCGDRSRVISRTGATVASHEPQAVRNGVRVRIQGVVSPDHTWAIGRAGAVNGVSYSEGSLVVTVKMSNRSIGGRSRTVSCYVEQVSPEPFMVRDRVRIWTQGGISGIVTAVNGDNLTLEGGLSVNSRDVEWEMGNLPGPSALSGEENCCGYCEMLSDVCECPRCYICREFVAADDFCSDCNQCYDHCTCDNDDYHDDEEEDDSVVHFDTVPLIEADYKRPGRRDHKKNPTSRLIACELEIARVTKNQNRGCELLTKCQQERKHSIVHDGSLPSGGFEINTCPAGGDIFVNQIEELCDVLAHYGARVTRECGFHVHVDARDFTYWDMQRLVRYYAKIERALFACVSPSRRNSHYAQPCGKKYLLALSRRGNGFRHAISESLYHIDMSSDKGNHTSERRRGQRLTDEALLSSLNPSLGPVPVKRGEGASPLFVKSSLLNNYKSEKYADCRYNALNLHSWYYRGTVEFRLHQGTTSARKVVNWGILWAGILDYAIRTPESTIIQMAMNPDIKPVDALLKAAPTEQIRDWILERVEDFGTRAMAEDEEMVPC